jgi:hypothetical protein
MQDKHQWMSHTLFDMAAFCDRNGMDRQRDVLLDAVAALSSAWSDPISTVGLGIESQNLGKASLHEQLAA